MIMSDLSALMTPHGQHAYTFVILISYRRLSSQFQISLSAVTLGIYLGAHALHV